LGINVGKKLVTVSVVGLLLAAGLWLGSGSATAVGSKPAAHGSKPVSGELGAFWKRCSIHVTMSGVEISPVEVLHMTCARAGRVIGRGHVLDTPGGPMFQARGYACRSRAILPRVDPSPSRLPAAEFCRRGRLRLGFVWDYAS
jgi:hypothetical protein